MPFIERMDYAYRVADVVVSRAGALSIAELAIIAKPSIFVPSPNVAEDHQTKNAQSLLDENACVMVKDKELKEKLLPALLNLIANKELQQQLSENMLKVARPNATEDIVKEIEGVL